MWLTCIAVLVAYLFVWRYRRSQLPPGPPRLPIIGNLHQAPTEAVWLKYEKWIEKYGPLVSVDLCGLTLILIGDYDTARDLLDKRANSYSSRPRTVMAGELVCNGYNLLFKPYDETFLLHQRLETPVVSPRASACYTPIQDLESKQLLRNLLESNHYPNLFERFAASVLYSITFGMRITTGEEWQLKESHECLQNIIIAAQFGSWIVNSLPFLNRLPEPLAPWKKTARGWHQKWTNLHKTNYEDALIRDGWNWAKDFQNSREASSMDEIEIAWALGVLCDAGVETTSTQLQIFVLACASFPETVTRAQQELDEVVGSQRLPGFEDLDRLPYIHAMIEESFRWHHQLPTGVPHATIKEDYYKGYRIPKGSIIMAMFSSMRKDPHLFEDHEDFRPERWLGKSQPNNFGYGRRVCPGRFIARNSLYIVVARLLWAFNIRARDGKTINLDESRWTRGFVSAPKPFDATFEPRSEQHRKIVEETFENTEKNVTTLLKGIREKQVEAGIEPRA